MKEREKKRVKERKEKIQSRLCAESEIIKILVFSSILANNGIFKDSFQFEISGFILI